MRERYIRWRVTIVLLALALLAPAGAEASWSYQNAHSADAAWWAGKAADERTGYRMFRIVDRSRRQNIERAQRVVRHPGAHRQVIRQAKRYMRKGGDLYNRMGFTRAWSVWVRRHHGRRVVRRYARPAAERCGEYGMIGYGIAKLIAGHDDSTAFKEGLGACMWGIHSVYRSRR